MMRLQKKCILIMGFLLGIGHPSVCAQQIDATGPVLSQELITLTRDTPMDQALRVIQVFSKQVVVDPQHLKTPIGVTIERQSWRQALDLIAQHNNLEVWQRETHYELLPGASSEKAAGDDRVTVDSREVNISAVFFQADRAALRELGIDWSTLSGGRVDISASHLGASQVASDQFVVEARANINRSLSVDVLLKAFESKNAGEIVASPQVKVRSGKTGYIQVGSDFSVTTTDFAGNAITQFVNTGTILTVTPVIRSQDQIDFVELEVEAERSSLIDPVRNLVSKTVARTSTLLRDNEQTAIGGLYGQDVSTARTGMPILKDLPGWFLGLRYLFGTDSKQVSKTELVVLLKVDIVPSIRQRAELQTKGKNLSEILEERREAFDEMIEKPKSNAPDTLKSPERSKPYGQ